MNKIEGLHHIAIATSDMKAQIEFFTDKLGMELVALYWMHGVENTWHGFLRLNDESSIAFVHNPAIDNIPVRLGETHSGNAGAHCARGTMQHLALKVKDDVELHAMRDRLRAKGVPVVGPMDHGFCKSIYFAGPEYLTLELSFSEEPIDVRAWVDPEVMGLAGITEEELARYTRSSSYQDQGGQVPQPAADSPGPHLSNYPEGAYKGFIGLSDEAVLAMSQSEPPVTVVDE
ncbi:MAG: VOC family protein [Gammaproteobacteria bacterium]|nr:VOC family protein [Gammaproteobacteria bacterium]